MNTNPFNPSIQSLSLPTTSNLHCNDDLVDRTNSSLKLNSSKVETYFDFIQNANIAPISDQDLYQPKNLATSLCLAVNSAGYREWPPKVLIYGHYSMVSAIEILCHSSFLDFRSIDKLLAYGPFEHLENVLMFLTGV